MVSSSRFRYQTQSDKPNLTDPLGSVVRNDPPTKELHHRKPTVEFYCKPNDAAIFPLQRNTAGTTLRAKCRITGRFLFNWWVRKTFYRIIQLLKQSLCIRKHGKSFTLMVKKNLFLPSREYFIKFSHLPEVTSNFEGIYM